MEHISVTSNAMVGFVRSAIFPRMIEKMPNSMLLPNDVMEDNVARSFDVNSFCMRSFEATSVAPYKNDVVDIMAGEAAVGKTSASILTVRL